MAEERSEYELASFEQFSLLPNIIRDFDKKKKSVDPVNTKMTRRKELQIGREKKPLNLVPKNKSAVEVETKMETE